MSSHIEDNRKKAIEEADRKIKIASETKKALQTEEHFMNFLKSYNPESVERFIKYYAELKAHWHINADSMAHYRNSMGNHYYEKALQIFKEIFIKKLFNKQCRWVAGEMDLEGIEVSTDFFRFVDDPASCTFVEPISAKEFECYMQFLKTEEGQMSLNDDEDDDDEYASSSIAIEFYHHYRSVYIKRKRKELPLWFYFYDACFGTSHLLEPPYTRTDLEQQYLEIWEEEIHKRSLTPEQLKNWYHYSLAERKLHLENPELEKAYIEKQNQEYIEKKKNTPQYIHLSTYDKDMMLEIMHLIEPIEVIKYYEAEYAWRHRDDKGDLIAMDEDHLQKIKQYIPVQSSDDYRFALREAHAEYERKEVMELLPNIFDTYRQCFNNGTPFKWQKGKPPKPSGNDMRKRIIAARKWKGEPDNVDFLKKENLR